jgi:hypothetical protein
VRAAGSCGGEVTVSRREWIVALPPWLTIGQVAEYCGVDRADVYCKMLGDLEVRRIGVRGGVMPLGRLIRIGRGSLLPLRGQQKPAAAGASSLGDPQASRQPLPRAGANG